MSRPPRRNIHRTAFASPGLALTFARTHQLTPWQDVANQWNAMSGDNLSSQRVWQIALAAETKLRRALRGEGEQ